MGVDFKWVIGAWLVVSACGASEKDVREPVFSVAASFNPVKECETTSFGRYVRGASCPGVSMLFVSREPSPSEMLANLRSDLRVLGQPSEARMLRVNGREQEAIAFTYGPPDSPTVQGLTTVLAVPGSGDSIEVQCYATKRLIDPKRCSTLLDAFIEQGLLRGEWPSVLSQSAARRAIHFDLAGHEVLLPGSCDTLGVFDVDCPEGHVQMHLLTGAEQLAPALRARLNQQQAPTLTLEREIPCAVDGLSTQCVVRKYRLPYGDWLHAYHAALDVRGTPVLLSCDTRASFSEILPGPMCARFFRFAVGALAEPETPE